MQMLPDLQGRVALVTGAARRTGRVIATKLAAAGASVLVNAMSSRAEAEALVADIEREHGAGRAMAHIADVSDPQAVRAMVAACVERFGGLDILVNNASIRLHAALDATTPEQWRRVLQVTLDGSFYCAQAAAPHLSRSGQGVVINIGGVVSHTGARNAAAIMTAKTGLEGLTRALAYDLGPNVRVNCVAPASMTSPDDPPERARTLSGFYQHNNVPLGRPGSVDEVTDAVLTLCGPAWRYMTGQVIHINGGVYFSS
jgi:3-oxoacyl-[acyl-carrier protein] reductase